MRLKNGRMAGLAALLAAFAVSCAGGLPTSPPPAPSPQTVDKVAKDEGWVPQGPTSGVASDPVRNVTPKGPCGKVTFNVDSDGTETVAAYNSPDRFAEALGHVTASKGDHLTPGTPRVKALLARCKSGR